MPLCFSRAVEPVRRGGSGARGGEGEGEARSRMTVDSEEEL
jgi:hypothetical protein